MYSEHISIDTDAQATVLQVIAGIPRNGNVGGAGSDLNWNGLCFIHVNTIGAQLQTVAGLDTKSSPRR
jgi:hypothetical protein